MQITSYRNLPIGKYIEISAIAKDESLEEIDRQVKVVAILNDMAEEDVLNLPIDEFSDLSKNIAFLGAEIKDDYSKIADSYKIEDFELIPVKDISKITTAQYIDFKSFAKSPESSMVEILSCFLVPRGMKYNQGYDIVEVQRAIRNNLSVYDTLSLSAFFLRRLTTLIGDSAIFSKEEAKKIPEIAEKMKNLTQAESSMRNGDGLQM